MFNLIQNNPFRILSLPVEADAKSISARVGLLKMYLQMESSTGGMDEFKNALPAILYTQELIRDASNTISKDIDRIYYSLFWFQKETHRDELALKAFKEGRKEMAATLWKEELENESFNERNFTGYKNWALLLLLNATRDNNGHNRQNALKGLNLFFQCWHLFSTRKLYKNLPGTDYIEEIGELETRLAKDVAAGFRPLIGLQGAFDINDMLAVLPQLPEFESLKNKIAKELASVPQELLTRKIEEALHELELENADGCQIASKLLNDTTKLHTEAEALIPEQEFILVSDKLAETITKAAQSSFNPNDSSTDWKTIYKQAINLALEASKLARSEAMILKVEKDIEEFKTLERQLSLQAELDEICGAILPQNIYKLKEWDIDVYPQKLSDAIDQSTAFLKKIKQEEVLSDGSAFLSDIIVTKFVNLIIVYGNHTYKYKPLIAVMEKMIDYKMSKEVRVYFHRTAEMLLENAKTEAQNSDGCANYILWIATIIHTIYAGLN